MHCSGRRKPSLWSSRMQFEYLSFSVLRICRCCRGFGYLRNVTNFFLFWSDERTLRPSFSRQEVKSAAFSHTVTKINLEGLVPQKYFSTRRKWLSCSNNPPTPVFWGKKAQKERLTIKTVEHWPPLFLLLRFGKLLHVFYSSVI